MAKPDRIRIAYEDFEFGRFNEIGRLADGSQFMAFVTGAFPTGYAFDPQDWRTRKVWLAVVHHFAADGSHLGSESLVGGRDIEGVEVACGRAQGHLEAMLGELSPEGPPELGDIWVGLFSVELDGVTHGLFYEQSEEEPEEGVECSEWVMLEPQDIMFHPPWDCSEYST